MAKRMTSLVTHCFVLIHRNKKPPRNEPCGSHVAASLLLHTDFAFRVRAELFYQQICLELLSGNLPYGLPAFS